VVRLSLTKATQDGPIIYLFIFIFMYLFFFVVGHSKLT